MSIAPNRMLQSLMRVTLSLGVVYALLTSFSGCRSARDNQIDILESELRSQEDYIYELEDYVVEYSDKLRDCRCTVPHEVVVEKDSTGPDLADVEPYEEPENHTTVKESTKEEPVAEEPLPEPEPQPQKEGSPIPDDIEVPDLDFEIEDPIGQDDVPEDGYEEADSLFAEDDVEGQLVYLPDPAETEFETVIDTADEEYPGDEAYLEDGELTEVAYEDDLVVYRQAERIVITKVLRGDKTEGAVPTLLTIVEARDANDEPADLDGMVSLMVMATGENSRRRLKRWDFSEEETISAWQSSQLGDGLHLELPLGKSSLPAGSVELWARLMTNDGRKLLARLPFTHSKLAALGEEPEPFDEEAAELALAEAKPLGGEAEKLTPEAEVREATISVRPKTQWRASVQAAHLATEVNSTSSSTAGWRSQPAGRLKIASRPPSKSKGKPVWTTGSPSAWSTQR